MIRVFTTWYEEPKAERRAEFLACLNDNLNNEYVGQVCVIAEKLDSSPSSSTKLDLKHATTRPTYEDFRAWINDIVSEDDVSIIANTDIYFDETVRFADQALDANECYALARWENGALTDRNDSQDAWMFRGKMRPMDADYRLGVPRCDNRFLRELREAGYTVKNPSFAIRANHVHAGEVRHYDVITSDAWVDPPYGYAWPQNLLSLPETLWYNARHPMRRVPWRFDLRATPLSLPGRVVHRIRREFTSRARSA